MGSSPVQHPWLVVLVIAGAAGVAQTFGRFTYSLLLTDVRDDLGLSNTVAGSLGTANLVAYLAGTIMVSVTVGRTGLVAMTRAGIVASTVGIGLLTWSPSLVVVAAGQIVAGFGGAAVWVTAPSLATASVAPERRGLAIGLAGTGIGGAMIAASAVAARLDTDSWRKVYGFQLIVAVLLVVAVALVVRVRSAVASPTSGRRGLAAVTSVTGWRPLLGAYAAYGLAVALFINYLVASLRDDSGYSANDAALAFSAFGAGTIGGGPLLGPVSDRFGRRWALVVAFGLMIVCASIVPTGVRPWSTVAAVGFGLAFTGVPTGVAATIRDEVDGTVFGAAFGAATLAFGAALMVGPQLGGVIGDVTGSFDLVFVLAAATSAVGLVLAVIATARPAVRPRVTSAR